MGILIGLLNKNKNTFLTDLNDTSTQLTAFLQRLWRKQTPGVSERHTIKQKQKKNSLTHALILEIPGHVDLHTSQQRQLTHAKVGIYHYYYYYEEPRRERGALAVWEDASGQDVLFLEE